MEKINWMIDPNHSEVQFKVKHLTISNVSTTFKIFKGNVQSQNEDFSNAEISFEIDANSIDTNHQERDGHLKSPIFYDTEKYRIISFNGKLQKEIDKYELVGELKILETKKNIKMDVEFTGTGKGRFSDTRAGFEINRKINRKDYGLSWSLLTEAVGEEVKLHFDIQLIKHVN